MATYAEKLKDPRWQKKRLEILERDKWTCQACGDTNKTLHVHHCYYELGVEPWDYPLPSLITLCVDCHAIEPTELETSLETLADVFNACGFISGDIEQLAQFIEFDCCDDPPFRSKRLTAKQYLEGLTVIDPPGYSETVNRPATTGGGDG